MVDRTLWPLGLLSPANLLWTPAGGVDNGGRSLSGMLQLDRTDGGPFWRATLERIPVFERDRVLAAQALHGLAYGGQGVFEIPRRPSIRSPGGAGVLLPHSDGTPFDDETLYVSGGVESATLTADAALYATTISLEIVALYALLGGEDFSIAHETVGKRMYRVLRILSGDGPEYSVEITPPLRDDVAEGTTLIFDNPGCVMTMTNADSFLRPLEYNRWAFLTAEFEEAFF